MDRFEATIFFYFDDMWTVYVLKSEKQERLYVGMSENLNRRLSEHNSGKVFSTKAYRPWQIILTEEYLNSELARKREKYLKSGYGKMWLKKKHFLIN